MIVVLLGAGSVCCFVFLHLLFGVCISLSWLGIGPFLGPRLSIVIERVSAPVAWFDASALPWLHPLLRWGSDPFMLLSSSMALAASGSLVLVFGGSVGDGTSELAYMGSSAFMGTAVTAVSGSGVVEASPMAFPHRFTMSLFLRASSLSLRFWESISGESFVELLCSNSKIWFAVSASMVPSATISWRVWNFLSRESTDRGHGGGEDGLIAYHQVATPPLSSRPFWCRALMASSVLRPKPGRSEVNGGVGSARGVVSCSGVFWPPGLAEGEVVKSMSSGSAGAVVKLLGWFASFVVWCATPLGALGGDET